MGWQRKVAITTLAMIVPLLPLNLAPVSPVVVVIIDLTHSSSGCSSQQMQTQAAPLSAQTAESNFSLSRPTASLSAQMQTLVNAQIAGASSENIPHPTSVRRPSQQQLRRGSMLDVQQKYPPVYANGTKILIAAVRVRLHLTSVTYFYHCFQNVVSLRPHCG